MRQIIFELSYSEDSSGFFNYSPGTYYKRLYSESDERTFTDAFGNVGFYDYQFTNVQNVLTAVVDGSPYTIADNLGDAMSVEAAIFFDNSEQLLYIHFINNERPLAKDIVIRLILGYANNYNETTGNIYNDFYYKPLLKTIPKFKTAVDPLEFEVLKFNTAKVALGNTEREFDNWRDRNAFNTPAQMKYSDNPTEYSDFEMLYRGYISNDDADWENFSVDLDDPRKALEQPIATRLITSTLFPDAPDGSIDKLRPVPHGKVFYRKCICIDDGGTPSKFLFLDTLYNVPSSLDGVYIDGVEQTAPDLDNIDLNSGTFELDTTDTDNVYASFTMGITNGVEIIKDLMENYDGLQYLSSFWDIDEVDEAEAQCRNTSVFVDDDKQLKKVLGQICFDCDLRFFVKNNGKYTIRLYDANREPSGTIYFDDWTGNPKKVTTGSNYLTSTTIEYQYREDKDEYMLRYANRDYEATAFEEYKTLKPKTYESGLYEESAAIDKSNTIMSLRSSVSDIVTRSVSWEFRTLEPTDFVIASPYSRCCEDEAESMAYWEIIDRQIDPENADVTLSMRYVKAMPVILEGSFFENGDYTHVDSQSFTDGSLTNYNNSFAITEEE